MNRTTILGICAVIAMIACDASADDSPSGWLVGGSAVTGWLKRDDDTIDDTSMGFKFFGQYRFNSWLGLEGAYYNSGNFSSSATSAGGESFDLLYQGFTLEGVAYIPLRWEQVDLYVRGGYFTFRVDSTLNGSNSGNGSDTGAVLGAGFGVGITERLSFRTAFDWYDADKADLRTVELGLEYHF